MTNCVKPPVMFQDSKGEWHSGACKMRNCPVCSKVLRNQLMDRVKKFFAGDPCYFNTITLQIDDCHNIMKYWRTLYATIKYYYPHILIFWVKEYTKRGKAHIHFITNRALDGKWLSRSWKEITKTSFIVKAGDCSNEIRSPAAYMLKYMTKAHGNLDMYAKGERIYGFLGARSPKKELLGFETTVSEVLLYQHLNINSKYWNIFYYLNMWIVDGKLIWVNNYL